VGRDGTDSIITGLPIPVLGSLLATISFFSRFVSMARQFRSIKGKMLLVFAFLFVLLPLASSGPLDESGCKKLGFVEEFDSFVQVWLFLFCMRPL
jgi:hypothetical protein